jgi:dihydrodipicolinate synthase/N-acetylneuraminate lyase
MLQGALAAAITPLTDRGEEVDEDAFEPYVDFLVAGGLDGILALGTTGEGFLLSLSRRALAAELFVKAARGRLAVAVHCGAQSTADTIALAMHAAELGADAVAVIAPPYFELDRASLAAHFVAAARACAPLPFYVYEFARTSGYPIALDVLARLREEAPNFAGMKVSDTPWEAFEPYLLDGLDVFVGPESLIQLGLEAGAVGAVSALAGAFPAEVVAVVRNPTADGAARLAELRAGIERYPRHAALKRVAALRGVPIRADVRPPLRDLTREEATGLEAWLAPSGLVHA